jgi:pimeloyl-ACP methyl ester carboxylesterase
MQPVTGAPWKTIPSTYVECTLDGAIPIEHQRAMSARCQNVVTLETDHSPFASKPAETADILERLARN